jgi:hypothetical protein
MSDQNGKAALYYVTIRHSYILTNTVLQHDRVR